MEILEKDLPDAWKIVIAKNIENNLFSKVSGVALLALGAIIAVK